MLTGLIPLAASQLKRGGRAKYATKGSVPDDLTPYQKSQIAKGINPMEDERPSTTVIRKAPDVQPRVPAKTDKVPLPPRRPADLMKKGGRAHKADGGQMMDPRLGIVRPKAMEFGQNTVVPGLKKGGKVHKADGGGAGDGKRTDKPENVYRPDYNEEAVDKAIRTSREPISKKEGKAIKGLLGGWKQRVKDYGRKEGGKAEHPDVAEDKALIKKMVKEKALKDGKCEGGRAKRYQGGGVFSGEGYPHKIPGVVAGGRTAKAKGGSRSAIGKEFDEEFAKRRAAGDKTFEFRGKTYNTNLEAAPTYGGPTRRGMGRPTPRMGDAVPNYQDQAPSTLAQPATGMTQTHPESGLFIGRQGEPAIVFQRDMPGPAPLREKPNVTYGGGQYGPSSDPASRIAAPTPAPMDGRMGRGQPSVTEYGLFGGRPNAYGERAINLSREVPAYPADAFMPRKSGGRTKGKGKGKTQINIMIAAGKHRRDEDQMPMPPVPTGRPQMPPMPPMGGPMAGAPMPPMGGGAPAMGGAPMPRKSGGRISKVAKSYKDMEAGAGSGEGRLQKTDIAKRSMRKAGGKVYRSYKDMDAGAGSGVGRLEKTEIASRKK